jgi:hypothetical protein
VCPPRGATLACGRSTGLKSTSDPLGQGKQRSSAHWGVCFTWPIRPALLSNLLLALRLDATGGVHRQPSIKKSLRKNFDPNDRRHSSVQLEITALAIWQGWEGAFEESLASGQPPVDVVIRRGAHSVPIEVKVAAMSQYNAEVLAHGRGFEDITMELIGRFDVYVGGAFPEMPSAEGQRELLRALEPLAELVSRDQQPRELDWHGARLTLTSGRTVTTGSLTMPLPLSDEAQRLSSQVADKALQAIRSGARWLRLDSLGGYMRFHPSWDKPLVEQLDAIVEDPEVEWAGQGFDGVILSSGLVMGSAGQNETASHPSGALACTRKVTPLHLRTTVVAPIASSAKALALEFASLYAREPDWLGAAIANAGLPPLTDALIAPFPTRANDPE